MKYAYQLTWEEFQEEQAAGTGIITFEGHLICAAHRKIDPKKAWTLYHAEYVRAFTVHKQEIRPEVIASNNDVVIPMTQEAMPAPISSAPEEDLDNLSFDKLPEPENFDDLSFV